MPFSPEDKHIVVNYHYVREPSEKLSGIHPCHPEEFERQLRFLSSEFRITRIEEVFNAAQEESEERLCAITFDDGLKDNFKNVVPILQKHRAVGTFFPIAQVLNGLMPITHKIHLILSTFPLPELVRRFNNFLEEQAPQLLGMYRITSNRRITGVGKIKVFDDVPTAHFKETIGMVPKEIQGKFLDMLLKEVGLDTRALVEEFFMSKGEIRELAAMGHAIGSHGLSHDALDRLDDGAIEREILTSREIIGAVVGSEPTLFSYPQSAPSKNIDGVLQGAGFTHAVIVNIFKSVQKGDHAFFIPRYDTNNVRDFLSGQTK